MHSLFIRPKSWSCLKRIAIQTGVSLSTSVRLRNRKLILGIETSCDDTGAAVVDNHGNIWGEAIHSQTKIHLETGGIIPSVARDLHKSSIEHVVDTALRNAALTVQDVDAIAVTVKPGLSICLRVGVDYAKHLVAVSGKPLIPIHHMEAHALTARMIHSIDFPFLVFLVSGGHCLLAVAKEVDKFVLLGKSTDIAPGDCLDKTARQMNLKNHPECSGLSGGAAIEKLAKGGNCLAFDNPIVDSGGPTCNFSFSGLCTHFKALILSEMKSQGVGEEDVLCNVADCCASVQFGVLRHLARRLQRAFIFCRQHDLLPASNIPVVLSGGVASNQVFRSGLEKVCQEHNASLICPPPKLCTDNGIMIAWNGMEKLLLGRGFADDPQGVTFQAKCAFGEDWTDKVYSQSGKLSKHRLLDELLLSVLQKSE